MTHDPWGLVLLQGCPCCLGAAAKPPKSDDAVFVEPQQRRLQGGQGRAAHDAPPGACTARPGKLRPASTRSEPALCLLPHCRNAYVQIAVDLLSWASLSRMTELGLGAYEAVQDSAIVRRVLPRTRACRASVYGLRDTRPHYDVPAALARVSTLTAIKLQVPPFAACFWRGGRSRAFMATGLAGHVIVPP
jgi:hypothetical protein